MTKINVLPSEISNMIAAGEVVERPASVVKELAENCIDAGATGITVEIKKGGITYIRVSDNGCGIAADEIETAFLRHATSKIKTAADLDGINTLGFRGEALASIAAVARVEIFTKPKEQTYGRCVTVEGGEVLENDEAGCADGTTMIVRNLFYNTPARMKFLKNDATETGYITDVVTKLILSHPEVAVNYINNGKTVLSSSGDGKLLSAIYTVFGRDYMKNMQEVSYSDDSMSVTGYIGNQCLARKDRRHQIFFVNSRNISCRLMNMAVGEAFTNTVMTGRFPVCVLKIEVNPRLVDVNVHPTKMEVRFSEEKKVYSLVYWAVKNALTQDKYIPEMDIAKKMPSTRPATGDVIKKAPSYDSAKQMELNLLKDAFVADAPQTANAPTPPKASADEKVSTKTPFSADAPSEDTSRFYAYKAAGVLKEGTEKLPLTAEKPPVTTNEPTEKPPVTPEKPIATPTETAEKTPVTTAETASEIAPQTAVPTPREGVDFVFVGQVFGTFMIIQKDNEMMFIDQHAAHERIYFERLVKEFGEKSINSQFLLLPVTMTLTATELDCAEREKEFFDRLGFEIDRFGDKSIIVRTAPDTLEEQEIRDCISEIISLIEGNAKNIEKQLSEDALHIVACKAALKGNHVLNTAEMKALCESVLALGDGINTCPHGRPIMIKMNKYSLEKQFKRIV